MLCAKSFSYLKACFPNNCLKTTMFETAPEYIWQHVVHMCMYMCTCICAWIYMCMQHISLCNCVLNMNTSELCACVAFYISSAGLGWEGRHMHGCTNILSRPMYLRTHPHIWWEMKLCWDMQSHFSMRPYAIDFKCHDETKEFGLLEFHPCPPEARKVRESVYRQVHSELHYLMSVLSLVWFCLSLRWCMLFLPHA